MAVLSYKLSTKRQYKAYQNYLERYYTQKAKMERRGTYMYDPHVMSFDDYLTARDSLIEEGQEININQTIVSKQQYEFTREQGRALKDVGEKLGLEIGSENLMNLRGGGAIRNEDLSLINEKLKELYPGWTGLQRAEYITDNIFFGSK